MDSQIEVSFYRGGIQAPGGMIVNQASQHPDFTNLTLEEVVQYVVDVLSIVKDTYKATHGEPGSWADVAKDVGNTIKDALKSENQNDSKSSRLNLLGSVLPSDGPAADEARVTFHAWSEDDLVATSTGREDPLVKIIDLGDKRYNVGDIHHYEHSFSIPLRYTPPGPYFFSFASGDSGLHFNVGIVSTLTLEIAESRHSGFFIQGTYGQHGNFELVVPREGGGLSHFWRDNNMPNTFWNRDDFATDIGQVDAVSLIQSNFSAGSGIGNFELVARTGDRLVFFFKEDAPGSTWQYTGPIVADGVPISGISGNPALIQSTFDIQGHFELVVPRVAGGISYFRRDNNPGANLVWHGPFDFATSVGKVDAVSLIQTNFGSPGVGELEVIARIGNGLARFWRVKDNAPYEWAGPEFFADGVAGTPSLIQGWYGSVGNYELVSPRAGGGLVQYWRNNDPGQGMKWNGPFPFVSDLGQVDEVSLIQGNKFITPTEPGKPGSLNVVARMGNQQHIFYRGTDGAINHIFWDGSFHHDQWTAAAGAPVAAGDPATMVTPKLAHLQQIFGSTWSRGQLALTVQPYPPSLFQSVVVTVFAGDAITHQPVDGEVIIDDSGIVPGGGRHTIGRTNTPFTYTFKSKKVKKFDPEIKQWIEETLYPGGAVKAPGYYEEGVIDWGWV